MNVLPVIERELRAGSRQPLTYALRLLAGGALVGTGVIYWLSSDLAADKVGGELFRYLHCALLGAIWVLVPMLTADSISRERREGTLALLFLTPLRPADIVLAKAMAQGLRAITGWLAALPVLTVPFILGGVSWKEAVLSVLVNFSSLCLALAAGLAASARCKNATRAMAAASLLGALLCATYLGALILVAVVTMAPFKLPDLFNENWVRLFGEAFVLATNLDGEWQTLLVRGGQWVRLTSVFGFAACGSFLVSLWLVMRLTARTVQKVWREESPSARVVRLQKLFTTPVLFKKSLRRWLRWELARNPIGWLERRAWSARVATWGWTAVVIVFFSIVFSNAYPWQSGYTQALHVLAWLLNLTVIASAAGSFRRERENGALELLLVAPLSEWQIIGGRLRGLWGKFLLPQILFLSLWLLDLRLWGSYRMMGQPRNQAWALVLYSGCFLCLPVVGLCYSILRKHFITAFVLTLVMGVLAPWLLALITALGLEIVGLSPWLYFDNMVSFTGLTVPFFQAIAALVYLWVLERQLKSRRFVGRQA